MRAIKNVTSSWNWPNLSASNCCTCPPTRPTSISSNACGNSSRRIVCTRPITTTLRSSNRPSHPVSLKLKPHTGPPSTPCFPTASRPLKNQKLCQGRVYKKFKAYQPLNCWWAEQGVMLYSEFRDGNVPAGHEQLRVLKDSLGHVPDGVKKMYLRSDTAGYQEELLLYCGEGTDPRFGVIEFAIGADVTEAFRAEVRATAESEWKPLIRWVDGKPQQTDQEWAEVAYVPNWAGYSRKRADYRFLAIREPLRQLPLGDEGKLPF